MPEPPSSAVGQSLRQFVALSDDAFKELLARYGFSPAHSKSSLGDRLAERVYRAGDLYVRVTATTHPRDAPAHCTLVVGQGSHQFPEGDWNSLALWRLEAEVEPTSPPPRDPYVLEAVPQLPALLQRMSADLERAAADFLSGDLGRFRSVRAAVAASRQPYTIWAPTEKGQYVAREDPVSTTLRARYAAEAGPQDSTGSPL